ncbi:MAG: UvrD-helicase domain-containing protein, partial [Candidatus Helarchaeota archaeon]|nr:UvrD-helicase domain-containing protein [Candidatus Helarchaeota archaeon]
MMDIRYLINENGERFNSSELEQITQKLDALSEEKRIEYRNQNASEIAKNNSKKTLIVSGPGTGKSFLFRDRIDYWFTGKQDARVLVTSFVRKLVVDLENDIGNDQNLTNEQKKQTSVFTLHRFARRIVEKNHGTSEWRFKPYFRIIGQFWKDKLWGDVLAYYNQLDSSTYSWQSFEEQLHNDDFKQSHEWKQLKRKYFELCKFYNAAGFADLILRARVALEENSQLNEFDFFIIDEYQDFNCAEDGLIGGLVRNSKGLLIVGDDDQVLYEKLKCGKAELIRNRYKNKDMTKAMLPFSSRNSYHIAKSATQFIQQNADKQRISKIYLPLNSTKDSQKIQIVACAAPTTAVDYIEKFITDHKSEIEERKVKLQSGEENDAFLLILTPSREVRYYQNAKARLLDIVSAYKQECPAFSDDYYLVLNYYSLARNPRNNFTFRKVMFYERLLHDQIHEIIIEAIESNKDFCDLDKKPIKDIMNKCESIKGIIENDLSLDEKISELSKLVDIKDNIALKRDLEKKPINQARITEIENEEEEEAELEELQTRKMCAIELMTIVGAKGLSADHVIVIGFDNVNMNWITRNAFYVAITRAR